jgi:predicted metal-binding protein
METTKEKLQQEVQGFAFEYAVIKTFDIKFSPEIPKACETNVCGKYNKCWTCPPAVSLEQQKKIINSYPFAFVFTTKTEVEDSFDYEGMMNAKKNNDILTSRLHEKFGRTNHVYGAGGCSICAECNYPKTCRFPEKIYPSIEAAGIDVTELSKKAGLRYNNGENTITYFSMVLLMGV